MADNEGQTGGRLQGHVTAFKALPHNVQGAMWMLTSGLFFVTMSVIIKELGPRFPAPLQVFYGQVVGMVILLPTVLMSRGRVFMSSKIKAVVVRGALNTSAIVLAFYAFQKMPLADANALSFTRALWLVPLAAFIVREHVGPLRIGAAVVGFLGVLVILRPGVGGSFSMGVPAAAMLLSSFLTAASVTGMKILSRDHSPTTLMVWSLALGTVFTLPGAILTWRTPTMPELGLLVLLGAAGAGSQACYIRGMSIGDAAAMGPIDYLRLVLMVTAGYVFFGDVPTIWTLGGAGIVVASTLFINLRELHLARRARQAADGAG